MPVFRLLWVKRWSWTLSPVIGGWPLWFFWKSFSYQYSLSVVLSGRGRSRTPYMFLCPSLSTSERLGLPRPGVGRAASPLCRTTDRAAGPCLNGLSAWEIPPGTSRNSKQCRNRTYSTCCTSFIVYELNFHTFVNSLLEKKGRTTVELTANISIISYK